ncbi:hypothetical protein NQZ79_g1553 [Umbelopsis isabellina]|nr:hypothetical protein NQZ79_g1553 [Umbelopsis isabellina]
MPATSSLVQDFLPVGFVDEVDFELPVNLRSNVDFPPLHNSFTDDWDCIDTQDIDDISILEDEEEWQQLELAIQRSLEPEYCFASVAKQAQHVPAPQPKLTANTMVFDAPTKRRQKAKEQDADSIEELGDSLVDLYPRNKVASRMREMATLQKKRVRRNLDCHICLSIIPPKRPEGPVTTLSLFHSRYSYSSPLTFHQYQHAIFKLLQIHERGLSAAHSMKIHAHADTRKRRSARRLETHEPLVDVI